MKGFVRTRSSHVEVVPAILFEALINDPDDLDAMLRG